ncbi:hypothetical protein KP509_17G008300 [Ceratopteris richardii]|uniref:Signal peptide peptidase n=1 Tax=Ceratopteris richardii TaxID=49495 RepID=A0A8T2SS11_CERRI|nr:hypothetical protein KP509_17G008300 [Ceratopteris richardii]KAH7372533.1 hypothetical protein KP509_17G008300 [Ceratopteris richardii]
MVSSLQLASLSLFGLAIAPLFISVDPNWNCILTACLAVFIGCKRSVKDAPPSESISKEHAMRFPFIGSAVLFSLFLLFKFLPKDLVNRILAGYFFLLGIIALAATILPYVEKFLPKKLKESSLTVKIPFLQSQGFELSVAEIIAGIPATGFCLWYVLKKHWLANNILGLAFSIEGIELLSLGSFKIGAILLVGLFFYDIFWVFFTPVMVSVAKSFDAPIKLLFPTSSLQRPYSMLGLGDIVIPGIFVALALRFDAAQGKGSFYFRSAYAGYVAGLTATIIVMNWFQAAQPALLYIVPGVLGFLTVHSIINGEIKELLLFDESNSAQEKKSIDSQEQKSESNLKTD